MSTTVKGKECQRWDSQMPHTHNYTSSLFPEGDISQAENYCRNPDHENKRGGPWCFVLDESYRKQADYCDVPFCKVTECTVTVRGQSYAGNINHTRQGYTCQRWDSQYPHQHNKNKVVKFPDDTLEEAANYCRNPKSRKAPWCHTTDPSKRRDFCDVPLCVGPATDDGTDIICKSTRMGQTYRGKVDNTRNGLGCQRWDSQFPHVHRHNEDFMFPDNSTSDAENYCRNPNDEPFGPWCYTLDPDTVWDYCDIDDCSGKSQNYTGIL